MANIYRGGMQISGNSGGGSNIDTTQLTQNIVSGVEAILRPTGHQYPNVNLYPVQVIPRFIVPSSSMTVDNLSSIYTLDNSITQIDLSNPDHLYILENLDASRFQNISYIFKNVKSSPGVVVDLSEWDTSNVKEARLLFKGLTSSGGYTTSGSYTTSVGTFNLSDWDVRNISDMSLMLASWQDTSSSSMVYFDSLILDNWNVTNVTKMDFMFTNVRVAELDLSTWNMSYVPSFFHMFDSYTSSGYPPILEKLLWGGAVNAIDPDGSNPALDLTKTIITPANANLFFQSLGTKTSSGTTTIKMPTTAQGADLSIAEAKGYTITNITQP